MHSGDEYSAACSERRGGPLVGPPRGVLPDFRAVPRIEGAEALPCSGVNDAVFGN